MFYLNWLHLVIVSWNVSVVYLYGLLITYSCISIKGAHLVCMLEFGTRIYVNFT